MITEAEARYIQPTYTRQPIRLTRGRGAKVDINKAVNNLAAAS
jgi:hypothetical protein